MKPAQVKLKALTDKHEYTSQFVVNLEEVIAYSVCAMDGDLETIHIYLSSGKDRVFECTDWDVDQFKKFLEEVDNHFFPPNPVDKDIKPTELDFYYV